MAVTPLTAPAYAIPSHAKVFTFDGATFHCTNITEEGSSSEPTEAEQRSDVTTLDVASGGDRVFAPPVITDPADGSATKTETLSITFFGATRPTAGATGVVTINGADYGKWKCTRSSLEYAVAEYVRGSATFTYVSPTTPPSP